jgi:hypothetical protein
LIHNLKMSTNATRSAGTLLQNYTRISPPNSPANSSEN